MGESCYRLLIFRYLLLIAYGCWLAVDRQKTKIWISFLCCCMGVSFILLTCYTAYEPKVIIYWTGTSCIAVLYMLPLLGMLIRSRKLSAIHAAGLEWMGRASFHIYLFQMVYYGLAADKLYPLFSNEPAALIFSVAFCLMGGGLFYIMERRISAIRIFQAGK